MGKKNKKAKQQSLAQKNTTGKPVRGKPPLHDNKATWRIAVLMGISAFILYANTLQNDFAYDDGIAVTQNTVVQKGISAIPEIFTTNYVHGYNNVTSTMYRPFTTSMFAIEWSISPNNPLIGHFFNCLFFALTAVVIFLLLTKIFRNQSILLPAIAAVLFIVHPIHTEVVANIKSRDELMSFFCGALSLLFMFKYAEQKKRIDLVITSFLFFSALMFKESGASFLPIFPLALYFFTNSDRKTFLSVIVAVILPLALQLIMRSQVLSSQTGIDALFLKIHNVVVSAEGFNEKSATIMMLLGRHLSLLFFPYPLACDYSFNQVPLQKWDNLWPVISLLVYAGMMIIAITRFRKKEAWVFGIIYFLVTMSLYSNILFPIGATIGERFLYIPSFGFCIMITGLLFQFMPSMKQGEIKKSTSPASQRKIALYFLIIVSVLFAAKTVNRNKDWANNMSLFGADVKKHPNSAVLNYLYGNEILVRRALVEPDIAVKLKMTDTVISYLDKAIAIYPEYGDAYSQRGLVYFRTDRMALAEQDYRQSIYRFNVGAWEDYNNMGVIFYQRQGYDSSKYYFNQAANVSFGSEALPFKNLASTFYIIGDFKTAINMYEKALSVGKGLDDGLRNDIYKYLSYSYEVTGNNVKAQEYKLKLR